MPRRPRIVIPSLPHHITQRGNYRQQVFFRDEDRLLYLDLLRDYARQCSVSVLGYCLMPNHVHLIVVPAFSHSLARLLQRLHSDYARSLNLRMRKIGHLWQARYGSAVLDENHFWAALVYVEQNPVRAALVEHAWNWPWSSARGHLGRCADTMLDTTEWAKRFTPECWERNLQYGLADAAILERLREATARGGAWCAADSLPESQKTGMGIANPMDILPDRLVANFAHKPRANTASKLAKSAPRSSAIIARLLHPGKK